MGPVPGSSSAEARKLSFARNQDECSMKIQKKPICKGYGKHHAPIPSSSALRVPEVRRLYRVRLAFASVDGIRRRLLPHPRARLPPTAHDAGHRLRLLVAGLAVSDRLYRLADVIGRQPFQHH